MLESSMQRTDFLVFHRAKLWYVKVSLSLSSDQEVKRASRRRGRGCGSVVGRSLAVLEARVGEVVQLLC